MSALKFSRSRNILQLILMRLICAIPLRVNKTLYIGLQYFLEMLSGWLLVHFEEI